MDEKSLMELMTHIRDHVRYPINKAEFMASCGNLNHVPEATRDWVATALPDRTYQDPEDVIHALHLPHEH